MREYKKFLLELLIIILLSCAVVFGVTGILGTLTSGWHFVDDHEFLEFSYMLKYKNMSVLDVIADTIRWDWAMRNNLLYYPSRIIMTSIIGPDSFALSVEKAIETVIVMAILYYCGKGLTDSKAVAVFFSLVCLVGFQSATWWKLGPEQMQATICFGISFLFLLKWGKNTKKIAYGVVSVVFATLMGFYHESFILVMPFFACWIVYENLVSIRENADGSISGSGDGAKENEYGKNDKDIKGLKAFIRKYCGNRAWYVVTILLICFAILLSIVVRLGLKTYKPVSYSDGISIGAYYNTLKYSLTTDLRYYWYFGIVLIGVLLTYYDKLKKYWADAAIALIFMFPQFVLYSKEGIAERYLLPVIIGYALFFIVFVYKSKLLTGGRKKLYLAVIVIMLLANGRSMIVEGDYYRFRGQSVTNALEEVERCADNGYKVMSCFGIANPEADWTVEYYLKSHGKQDVFYWNEETGEVFTGRPYAYRDAVAEGVTASDMDVIFTYNRDDRHFVMEPSIDLSDYKLVVSGSINIYYKNDIVGEISQELIDGLKVKPTIYGIGVEN